MLVGLVVLLVFIVFMAIILFFLWLFLHVYHPSVTVDVPQLDNSFFQQSASAKSVTSLKFLDFLNRTGLLTDANIKNDNQGKTEYWKGVVTAPTPVSTPVPVPTPDPGFPPANNIQFFVTASDPTTWAPLVTMEIDFHFTRTAFPAPFPGGQFYFGFTRDPTNTPDPKAEEKAIFQTVLNQTAITDFKVYSSDIANPITKTFSFLGRMHKQPAGTSLFPIAFFVPKDTNDSTSVVEFRIRKFHVKIQSISIEFQLKITTSLSTVTLGPPLIVFRS